MNVDQPRPMKPKPITTRLKDVETRLGQLWPKVNDPQRRQEMLDLRAERDRLRHELRMR